MVDNLTFFFGTLPLITFTTHTKILLSNALNEFIGGDSLRKVQEKEDNFFIFYYFELEKSKVLVILGTKTTFLIFLVIFYHLLNFVGNLRFGWFARVRFLK